eukprot:TRINITY_DN257_c0_g1_i12.p1 TRINITY_DN257_c0_g1~~TRINITY_DN257_c0_g1_i12.p1  ORF type:complete len:190 (+),score=29.57 TRINITY_DN257_c0_g1_i12:115-684(+)
MSEVCTDRSSIDEPFTNGKRKRDEDGVENVKRLRNDGGDSSLCEKNPQNESSLISNLSNLESPHGTSYTVPTQYTKKKKEYVPKTTYVADVDEFEDILVSGWFYIDFNGQQQGPYTTRDMKEWYVVGFFTDDMLVSRVNATEWKTVKDCEEFKHLEQRPFTEQSFIVCNTSFDQVRRILCPFARLQDWY